MASTSDSFEEVPAERKREFLGTFGFSLRSENEDPLHCLVRLYKGAEFVPGKQMFRWVKGLDEASFTYLRKQGTLGALSLRGRMEYLSWRHDAFPKRDRFAPAQAELLSQGLAQAGLSLFGEG